MAGNALQAVLDKASQETAPRAAEPAAEAAPAAPAKRRTVKPANTRGEAKPERSSSYRPVRDGKRFVGAHFHPDIARQLRMISVEDDTTIQQLLEEAVDLLFVKKGKAKIAQLMNK